MTNRRKHTLSLFLFTIILLIFVTACSPQDDTSPIEFVGAVTVIDGETITVGGFTVDISNASLPTGGLQLGEEVRVTGLQDGNIIVAVVVVPLSETGDTPDETSEDDTPPESTTAPEATADTTDPVSEASEEPVAETTETTDTPTETQEPVIVGNGEPIIVIEGPVQEININSIVIFDIEIEVDPSDSILTQIRIGDTIRIQGQSSFEGTTIIIVAINITIIETSIIVINNPVYVVPGVPRNCKVTRRGRVTCKKTTKKSS